ncbi:MAG: hypothetical protein Q7V14_04425 [Coriobacteriia bacterium]|nr:hypothetical protein [Coriobacteriia bacterium]
MIVIDTKSFGSATRRERNGGLEPRAAFTVFLVVMFMAIMLVGVSSAYAGRSSTGKLAFYPCVNCHPVTIGVDGKPTKPLPVDLKKHEIVLEVHDTLGTDDKACLACHDDPSRNPGMLILPDGSLEPITGNVSKVCQRCHFEKYREWEVGIHGKHEPKCTSAGCHDPHTPSWIYIAALPPFQGTGLEVRAVSEREPFTPLAGPPPAPGVLSPLWLVIAGSLGGAFVIIIIGYLILGGFKR